MAEIKSCLQFNIAIAEALLEPVEVVAHRRINAELEAAGVPLNTPVQVVIHAEKYWYEVIATWLP